MCPNPSLVKLCFVEGYTLRSSEHWREDSGEVPAKRISSFPEERFSRMKCPTMEIACRNADGRTRRALRAERECRKARECKHPGQVNSQSRKHTAAVPLSRQDFLAHRDRERT
jgi:hypothetical protein